MYDGKSCCFLYTFCVLFGGGESDIILDRVAKKKAVLRNITDLLSQTVKINLPDVFPIKKNSSFIQVKHTHEQLCNGCLTAACSTHNGYLGAAFDFETK